MGSSSRRLSRREPPKEEDGGSCCTWPRIIIMVIVLAVAGILIWKFAPVDEAINSILPNYNSTSAGEGGEASGGNADSDVPIGGDGEFQVTGAPTITPPYQFIQCPNNGQACCNGLDTNCNLRANEILYATLHNAMATFEDGFIFGPNHEKRLEGAVEAGYRGINLDICNCGGQTVFCHGICSLGPRNVGEVMEFVNNFLDDNPTEVIVLIYQINSAVDQAVDLNAFYDILLLVDGFVDKMYVHPGVNTPWPTLRELTDPSVNKRVIHFHYNGPDCNVFPEECPNGLHWYYDYASDNDWNHGTISSISNTATSCTLRENPGGNKVDWIGLNNFVSPPSKNFAARLNSYDTAKTYVDTCSSTLGNDINFIIADFWGEGELPRMTQDHNKARAFQQARKRTLLRKDQ